jgi:hypothetical protein
MRAASGTLSVATSFSRLALPLMAILPPLYFVPAYDIFPLTASICQDNMDWQMYCLGHANDK